MIEIEHNLLLMIVCHIPLMVMGELPANDILPAVLGLLGSMLAGGLILVWIKGMGGLVISDKTINAYKALGMEG